MLGGQPSGECFVHVVRAFQREFMAGIYGDLCQVGAVFAHRLVTSEFAPAPLAGWS